MNPVAIQSQRVLPERVVLFVLRSLVVLWAAFWLWFIAAALISEPSWEGLRHGGVIGFAILAAAAAACIYPPVGGVLLITGGVFAAWFFNNDGARALLAAPAIVLGIAFVLIRFVGRHAGGGARAGGS